MTSASGIVAHWVWSPQNVDVEWLRLRTTVRAD